MRHSSIALLALLVSAGVLNAQQAAPQGPTAGTPEQFAAHLAAWEREMAGVKSLSAECKHTEVNRVRNDRVEWSGFVKVMKSDTGGGKVDKLISVYLEQKGNPSAFEKFVSTGDLLYQFSWRERLIYVRKLGKAADDTIIDTLFQMKADAMKKRYDMTLVYPQGRDDPNYIYFDIKPRQEADKAEFQRARLVLIRRNYLPAQLWFEEPNGNYHTWDLSKVAANDPGVKAADFVAPEKPAGWQIKEIKPKDSDNPPRVYRPAGPG
jgi:TIGR03009 family protein